MLASKALACTAVWLMRALLFKAATHQHSRAPSLLERAAAPDFVVPLHISPWSVPPCAQQAVCHSASAHGTGEVSTCNYEARAFGVRSGMMIRWGMGGCGCFMPLLPRDSAECNAHEPACVHIS